MNVTNDRADERPVATADAGGLVSTRYYRRHQRRDMLALEMGLRGLAAHPAPLGSIHVEYRQARRSESQQICQRPETGDRRRADAVRYLLTGRSNRGQVMRFVLSFRPFVSKNERMFCAARAPLMSRSDIA